MLRVLVLIICSLQLWGTSLTGSLNLPNGSGATGYLYLSLSRQAALSADGGCGGPATVVPTAKLRITVTSGALIGSPTVYGNDCLLPGSTYYDVQFTDNNGNVMFNDRWVITGSSIDIGTIVSVVVTGTTGSLGSAGVTLSTPTGDQTVTQPPGTNYTVNNLKVTDQLTLPGGFGGSCTTSGCQFGLLAAFTQGLGTAPGTNSTLYMGSGNFYSRTFTGADASCAGVTNGWTGIRTDTKEIQVCIGSTMYKIALAP